MKKQGQTKQYEGSAIPGTFLYLQQRDSPSLIFPGHTVYWVLKTLIAAFSFIPLFLYLVSESISEVTETHVGM